MNVSEYKEQLDNYNAKVNSFAKKISEAEKQKIVAETQLNTVKEDISKLETECKEITGKGIEELDKVIEAATNEINEIFKSIESEE